MSGEAPDPSQIPDISQLSLQGSANEGKQGPPGGPTMAAQEQMIPDKREQPRRGNGQQAQWRGPRSEEKAYQQRQCRNGARCNTPNCDFLHPEPAGWMPSAQGDFVRFTDGRPAQHAPIGYHYSVDDQYSNMYASGAALPNVYNYHQPGPFDARPVRVMQAYPPQYNSYDPQMGYDGHLAYDNSSRAQYDQPQQPWAPQYDYNPTYFDPSFNDVQERRAEQIGQGEGFGDGCPCCSGNPENCQAQQCAERGFCGCLFGAMDADVVDDTWKDEWFAASRTCACCEGYIYRCKVQDDACTSGTCFCSHTKGIAIPGTTTT